MRMDDKCVMWYIVECTLLEKIKVPEYLKKELMLCAKVLEIYIMSSALTSLPTFSSGVVHVDISRNYK